MYVVQYCLYLKHVLIQYKTKFEFFYIFLYLMKSKEKCCTLENIANYALKQAINFYTIHFHSQKSVHDS